MAPLSPLLLLAAYGYRFAAANPVPTPPPLRDEISTQSTGSAQSTCTTVATSLDYGFRGNFTSAVAKTVYTTTQIVYSHVPCGGCILSVTGARAPGWGGIGPVEQITATVTASDAFTTISTVCSADTMKPKIGIPRAETTTPPAPPSPAPRPPPTAWMEPSAGPDCTTTRFAALSMTHGPVKTVWTNTVTTTAHIDCGGCNFLASTIINPLNPGPQVEFLTTETASTAATATTYVCLKTPSVVSGPAPTNTLPIERTKRGEEVPRTTGRL